MMNLHQIEFSVLDHALFFFLAIVLPVISIMSSLSVGDLDFDRENKVRLYYSNGFFLYLIASIVLTIWNYMNRSFADFGFQMPYLNPKVYIFGAIFILLYSIDLTLQLIFERNKSRVVGEWNKNTTFLPKTKNEYIHYAFLAVAAGICEEILFRGFLIHYLVGFLGDGNLSLILAVVLPAILFSIGHWYQGKWAMLKIFLGAILFGLIYLYSASLLIVVIFHILVDLISAAFAYFVYYKNTNPQGEEV